MHYEIGSNYELEAFLDLSVHLRVLTLKEKGGPKKADLNRIKSYLTLLGEKGNFLWTKSPKKGDTAKVSNAVADAIAVLSFLPGGLDVFGRHWENSVGEQCKFQSSDPFKWLKTVDRRK